MCLRGIRMVSKGKEKRISFEAEGEGRMRRRRKFSSNPSWVRVYEIKLMEHLGLSLDFCNQNLP